MEIKEVPLQKSKWDIIMNGYGNYVDEWFLMGSPIIPLLIVSAYLLFVLKIGPAYMKNKPAYTLRKTLIFYNAIQVLYSCFMVGVGIRIMYTAGFIESTCFMSNEKHALMLTSGGYCYLMAKLTELLDTVFFVLRKKWNQITFLHVYHHSVMFTISWICLKFDPSYNFAFVGTLNTFVHIIMYAYYGLSAFPSLKKYLWWKKYITKMQMIQFCMMFVSVCINFFTTVCPPSYFMFIFALSNSVLFFYLFREFYISSYKKNKDTVKVEEKSKNAQFNIKSYDNGNTHKISEKIR